MSNPPKISEQESTHILYLQWHINQTYYSAVWYNLIYSFISFSTLRSYLSDMATCSSIDEPVLVFQLPEIDVRLLIKIKT